MLGECLPFCCDKHAAKSSVKTWLIKKNTLTYEPRWTWSPHLAGGSSICPHTAAKCLFCCHQTAEADRAPTYHRRPPSTCDVWPRFEAVSVHDAGTGERQRCQINSQEEGDIKEQHHHLKIWEVYKKKDLTKQPPAAPSFHMYRLLWKPRWLGLLLPNSVSFKDTFVCLLATKF